LLRIHVSGIIRNYSRRPCLNKLLHLLLRDEGPSAQVIQNEFVAPLAVAQRTIVEYRRRLPPSHRSGPCPFHHRRRLRALVHQQDHSGDGPEWQSGRGINRYARLVLNVFLNGIAVR
jgi:hypothetical protein